MSKKKQRKEEVSELELKALANFHNNGGESIRAKQEPQKKDWKSKKQNDRTILQNKIQINSENKHKFKLPKEASDLLKKDGVLEQIDNLYLMHHQFIAEFADRDKKGKANLESLLSYRKSKGFKIKEEAHKTSLICELLEKTKTMAEHYNEPTMVEYEPLDKLAIGIGGASPFGNSLTMTLHPLYGIPYIPATAIKGMFRHYWFHEVNDSEEDGVLLELFGDKDKQGKLIFFDIFPKQYELIFDVMTPHYQDYYSNQKQPADDQNPVPIIFPCLKGAEFDVYISSREAGLLEKYEVYEKVQEALRIYGLGAKTALGYGIGK